MANLTTKELSALNDQLGLEKVMYCKYQAAAQGCTDTNMKTSFQQYANQHKQKFDCLLGHLQ